MMRLQVTVEHYESCIGISKPGPRLSWFEGEAEDWREKSYTLRLQHFSTSVVTRQVMSSESVSVVVL